VAGTRQQSRYEQHTVHRSAGTATAIQAESSAINLQLLDKRID